MYSLCGGCINIRSPEPKEKARKEVMNLSPTFCKATPMCVRPFSADTRLNAFKVGEKILCFWCMAASTNTPVQMMTEIIMTTVAAHETTWFVSNQVCLDMG